VSVASATARLPRVAASDVRQLDHWRRAIDRLGDLESLAPIPVWQGLEHYTGQSLRRALLDAVDVLRRVAATLEAEIWTVATDEQSERWRGRLIGLRRAYFRTESMIDFFGDALATRAPSRVAALLRACDHLARRAMQQILLPLGRQIPGTLVYLDKGAGAAVLRPGVLWSDGMTQTPLASVKIARHNLLRGTALLHECGHVVDAVCGWRAELADALGAIPFALPEARAAWRQWSPELAADAVAAAHTGYASLIALRDVVDGDVHEVFQYYPGTDPHPIPYLRCLVVGAVLDRAYGPSGPWSHLIAEWRTAHRIDRAPRDVQAIVAASEPHLPAIADALLWTRYRAFGGASLAEIVDPERVSLAALQTLSRASGAALYKSPAWLWDECVRLLALTGWQAAGGIREAREAMQQQEEWMLRLGAVAKAA
jgi:hypothetical protein